MTVLPSPIGTQLVATLCPPRQCLQVVCRGFVGGPPSPRGTRQVSPADHTQNQALLVLLGILEGHKSLEWVGVSLARSHGKQVTS